jgi:hypothetical protein
MTTRSRHKRYLTERQVDEYRENGFLTITGICSLKEIRSWQEECRRLWDSIEVSDDNPRLRWCERVDGGRVAHGIDPVLDISPVFEQLAQDGRFVRTAADVLGGGPRIFNAKLVSKWPGTAGYQLHQDYPHWSFDGDIPYDDFVSVLIPIDPFDAAGRAIEVIPGLHHGILDGLPEALVDGSRVNMSEGMLLALGPGDVGLLHGLTPHRSGPNRSAKNRELLLVTYVRAGR